jgi:hypothetical protein
MEREKNMSTINNNVPINHTLHMYFVVGHMEKRSKRRVCQTSCTS